MDKLASIEKSATTGCRSEFGSYVDQHLKISQNFKPTKFRRASDLIVAEHWLLKRGKISDRMIRLENRRVVLATFMLEEKAE